MGSARLPEPAGCTPLHGRLRLELPSPVQTQQAGSQARPLATALGRLAGEAAALGSQCPLPAGGGGTPR